MRLTRLVVQGFKSFKDRTVIHFDQGITGIVGPNGCGKSNIVDALFWVMGEMSAKHLRGDTMKDVIFAGSSRYTPASWAEVTLVLENNESKHIHIGNKISNPSEIQLTRKLYRNSETEYRINGVPCRLKDIQEIFMDTGAGAKSYSIIAQGEIERLVQAKPQERRVMIEEVAGITKFKLRRRESLKKIEQTKINLSRLSDLQQELEKNLNSLGEQAEKAEKACKLKDIIKENELLVESNRIHKILKERRDFANELVKNKTILETNKLRRDNLEISLEDERVLKEELQLKLDEFQKIFNEMAKVLAASEAKVEFLAKSKEDKSNQVQRFITENKTIQTELDEIKNRCEELIEEKNKLSSQMLEDNDLSELEEKVSFLKLQMEDKQDEVNNSSRTYDQLSKTVHDLDQELFKNTSRQGELAFNLQDINAEIEALEKQYSGLSFELVKEREKVEAASGVVEKLTQEYGVLKEKIELLQKNELIIRQQKEILLKESITVDSKLKSLKEINEALEGVKQGTSKFLKEQKSGLYDLMGNALSCDEKYSKPVQRLLSDYLETLISQTNNINELVDWHKEHDHLTCDLAVLKSGNNDYLAETQERLKLQLSQMPGFVDSEDAVVPLNTIVSFTANYSDEFNEMFEGYYVVKNLSLDSAQLLSGDIKFKALVSEDGSVLIKNQDALRIISVGNSDELSQGIIIRNTKINELENTSIEVQTKLSSTELNYETISKELATTKELFEITRDKLSDAKSDYSAEKSRLESKTSGFEMGSARLQILNNRKNEISKQRFELIELEETLSNKLSNKKEEILSNEEMLSSAKEGLVNVSLSYRESKDELVKRQVEINSLEARLQTAISRVSDFEKQIEKSENKFSNNTVLIASLSDEILKLSEDYEYSSIDNKNKSEELKKRDEEMSAYREDLVKLLKGMQDRENEVRQIGREISLAEKKFVELEVKLERFVGEEEQITRNVFEKYQVDLRSVVGKYIEYSADEYFGLTDLSSMYVVETENGAREVEKIHYDLNIISTRELDRADALLKKSKSEFNQLGDINWQAIEDYRKQKLRCAFLREQEVELKQSLDDLERAIIHIDNKSRERFKAAFDEVSERFKKVFPIIFGGGSALLNIVGDLDDPECGVDIVAQPPGKKMQNINLMSGGEKALTAVSLIFSIFLVKPSPFCLLDEVDAPLDDANVGRFNELLREMSNESQFILITHNKKTMEMNDTLYGITMEEPGISKAVSVQLQ